MRRLGASDADRPLSRAEFADLLQPLLGSARHVLLAVSGGPDSTALLHAAAAWRLPPGPVLSVATVDHGLRPDAASEAAAVESLARLLGLPHRVLAWSGRRPGRVSQAAAREARYRLLVDHARAIGADAIATAHTQDDQAETVLMRLAAGSGLRGLAAMDASARREDLTHLRPFLSVPKARLLASCRQCGWTFADDPTNADATYARPRWRALMPSLAAEGLDARRLFRASQLFRRADEALDEVARRAVRRARLPQVLDGIELDAGWLVKEEPAEVVIRALRLALIEAGAESDGIRLERLERCGDALARACEAGRAWRGTLAGRLLALDRCGRLAIGPEPARRRGRLPASTTPAAGPPHSLGITRTGA